LNPGFPFRPEDQSDSHFWRPREINDLACLFNFFLIHDPIGIRGCENVWQRIAALSNGGQRPRSTTKSPME
jgi:hypothetical protein